MKVKGLRKKISFVIIVPMALGILLTSLAPMIYLMVYYPNFLDNYTNKMISNQKESLLNMSQLLSWTCGYSYVQKVFNFVNIGGDLISQYLFYGIDINSDLDPSKIYINSKKYSASNPDSVDISVWNLKNLTDVSELNTESWDNLNMSALFNPVIKSISMVGKQAESSVYNNSCPNCSNSNFYKQTYLSFTNDGLYYVNPPNWNNSNSSMNCNSSSTGCRYCDKNIKDPYYDPRCQKFFNETSEKERNEAILIDPYNFTDGSSGQSVCRGQWNYTSSEMLSVLCTDISNNDIYQKELLGLMDTNPTYTYVLNLNGSVVAYKDEENVYWKNITTLEFGNNKEEIKEFNKKILPLFQNQVSEFKYYTKNGEKMMVAVSPISMMTTSTGNFKHIASVAVVMKKNHVEEKFNKLESSCQTSLQNYLYLHIALLVPILIFCMILTDKLTYSIIFPIDRLATILKKMKDGDLAIDIMATYEPSPLEIHSLYEVFDKLRVVLRFSSITSENIIEAFFVYSQALNLFIQFGNERGMEFCYRELGCICYKQRQWEEAAQMLDLSLKLALKLELYDLGEVAKRKMETAKAFLRARIDKNYAMNLFAEALDTFSKRNNSTQVVCCLIEVAETLLETQDLSIMLLDFIEKNLDGCETYERSIVSQKFLFVKASFLRRQGKYREACYLLSNIIEIHCDFIPEIWIGSVNLLILICKDCSVDSTSLIPLQSQRQFTRKDIVLVLSESLIGGPISWVLPGFLKSVLDPNDRLSFLQFGSKLKVNFNLTRFPMNIFSLENDNFEETRTKVLYDCVIEGFRQLRVNSIIRKDNRQCKECMIIVTDCVDYGSQSKFTDFISLIESSEIEVIVVSCFLEERIFDALLLATEKCSIFNIKYKEQVRLVFRQLEAFLCPYKEVYVVE